MFSSAGTTGYRDQMITHLRSDMEPPGTPPGEEEEEEEAEEWLCREPAVARAATPKRSLPCTQLLKTTVTGNYAPRTIVHIDMDCFYAQVEMIRNPDLKDKPLGVQQKYLVVTCNYVARSVGVKKLMSIKEAKEICPQLVLVSGEDLTHYREMSYKVTELLEEFSPLVERLGFDENVVDVTEMAEKRLEEQQRDGYSKLDVSGHIYNNQILNGSDPIHVHLAIGSHIAAEMRAALCDRLGLTGCAGVATNKLLSKLVAGVFKPNQQTIILPENHQHLIDTLDHVARLPGIGYKTTKRLESLGIKTPRDLQIFPLAKLEKDLGVSIARRIQMLSCGEDDSLVTPTGPPQSLSDEDSFKKCSTEEEVRKKIEELLGNLLNRVHKDGRKPHTMRLTIRQFSPTNKWFNRESRQCPVPSHIIPKLGAGNCDVLVPLGDLLVQLFKKMINVKMPFHLTLINVCFSNLKSVSSSTKGSMDFFLTPKTLSSSRLDKIIQKREPVDSEDPLHNNGSLCITSSRETESSNTSKWQVSDTEERNHQSLPLPDSVDQEVFSQLPEDIKKEILLSGGSRGIYGSTAANRPSTTSKGMLTFFSQKRANSPSHSSKKEKCSVSIGGMLHNALNDSAENSILDKPLGLINSSPPSDGGERADKTDFLEKDATESPSVSSIKVPAHLSLGFQENDAVIFMDTSCEDDALTDSSNKPVLFPSGIDPRVFSELPSSVQQELMAEWSQKSPVSKMMVKNHHETTKAPKGKKVLSVKAQKNNSLLKYFKHK